MEKFVSLLVLLFAFLPIACSNSENRIEKVEVSDPGWESVRYDDSRLRYSGRIAFVRSDFAVLSWSGTSVTVGFEGTALEAMIWASNLLYLDVFVDGEEDPSSVIKLEYEDGIVVRTPVVSGLPFGKHVVTLYKRTEGNLSDLYLSELYVQGRVSGEFLPSVPEHRIEFVGNSITCGSDVLMPAPGMDYDQSFESSYYGYAGQTAKNLGAEAHIICSGGHGVYLNYDGSRSLTLPVVYNRTGTLSLYTEVWDHEKWHPDVVVMNLGTNDFASGEADSAEFVNATVKFVRHVRECHPVAKIVLLDGPMLTGDYMVRCRKYLDEAKRILEDDGETGLYRYSFEPRSESPFGVRPHPDKAESAENADSLSSWMRSEFGWN